MPPEMIEAIQANPEGFGDAMGAGMEAFAAAMEGGGDMGAAFESFGDIAGPMMADLGVPQEMFDAVGDMVGAAVGPAMMMGPADAGGPEIGAMMHDAVDMMLPEGMDMPGPVADAMMDMGQGMADAGVMPHDVAGEMMTLPGDPGYPLPVDGAGDPVVVPGDPASCPADACQPPPMDGAMADMPNVMPPEGGYDHAPMGPEMVMPEPMTMDVAMDAGALQPGTDGMAPPDPTGELSGAENIAPAPVDDVAPPADMAALGDALGGNPADEPAPAEPADVADAAIGAAMDAATDQGGAPGADAGANADAGHDDHDGHEPEEDTDSVDPSAGIG